MNSERFARLKAIVLAAADRPLSERAAYLETECGDDQQLRREAEALLEADADGILERYDAARLAVLAAADPPSNAPPRLEHYLIHEELGRGGMGVVYRAEQLEPLRRSVALKVMPAGVASTRAVRRFEAERQALALMEHPHIARVFDAGQTEDGRSFFAMELVDGRPITQYCRDEGLPLRARLRLMLPVCAAVQHAHHKGIVHRDLKPSNILVCETDGVPAPKVIDFGIAKADVELVAGSATLTVAGQLLGTLDYMSPEQVAGGPDVDTRTDVYSLGVVLYELIAGERPRDLTDLPLAEAIRVIQDQRPKPLTTSRPDGRRVDADLRTIVEKALAGDVDRRYAGAAALGDDLEHYLDGQPIAARPASAAYQLRKLVVRHRLPAALMGTLVLVLAVFSIAMAVLFGAQRQQRQRAESEARKANAVVDFVVGMLGSPRPGEQGRDVTVREVLDTASDDLRESFGQEPEVGASIHRALGVTYRALGLYGESELHLRTALALRDSLFEPDNADRLQSLDDLAGFLMDMGEFAAADSLYDELLRFRREAADADPAAYADALNNAALARQARGRLDTAATMLREAVAIEQRLGDRADATGTSARNNLVTVLTQMGRYREAEVEQRAIVAASAQRYPDDHPILMAERSNLAKIWHRLGRYAEAESLYRALQPAREKMYDENHPRLAMGRVNLAMVLQDRGRFVQADSLFAISVGPIARAFGPDHSATAVTDCYLGSLRLAEGRLDVADSLLTSGSQRLVAARGKQSPHLARALEQLARVRHARGDTASAGALYRRARDVWAALGAADDHPDLAAVKLGLGRLALERNDLATAEVLLRQAHDALARNLAPDHRQTLLAANALGAVLVRMGRRDEGVPLLASSHDRLLADPGLEPFDRAAVVRRQRLLAETASR